MNKSGEGVVSQDVNKAASAFVIGIALLAVACGEYDARETSEKRTVAVGRARSARVQVDMGAGELRVEGGSDDLLDADFVYSGQERPEVHYDVSNARGFLSVRQPPNRGLRSHVNRWDLHLNDKSVDEMRINIGAGDARLKLVGMSVARLEVDFGAGELNLDLTGPWDNSLDASVRGGVGQATVRLPRGVGVRVHATGGIGGIDARDLRKEGDYFYNDAYGKSPVILRLDITGGIGQINLIG